MPHPTRECLDSTRDVCRPAVGRCQGTRFREPACHNPAGTDSVNVSAEPTGSAANSTRCCRQPWPARASAPCPIRRRPMQRRRRTRARTAQHWHAAETRPTQAALANTPSIRACAAASDAARCSAPMPMPSARMNSISLTPRNANTWRKYASWKSAPCSGVSA